MLRQLGSPWGATEGFVFWSEFCSLLHWEKKKKSFVFFFFFENTSKNKKIPDVSDLRTGEKKIVLPESFLLFLILGDFFFSVKTLQKKFPRKNIAHAWNQPEKKKIHTNEIKICFDRKKIRKKDYPAKLFFPFFHQFSSCKQVYMRLKRCITRK